MSYRWAWLIIISVVFLTVFTGWSVYQSFSKEKDISEYSNYITEINPEIDTELIKKIFSNKENVYVTDEEITPKNNSLE